MLKWVGRVSESLINVENEFGVGEGQAGAGLAETQGWCEAQPPRERQAAAWEEPWFSVSTWVLPEPDEMHPGQQVDFLHISCGTQIKSPNASHALCR